MNIEKALKLKSAKELKAACHEAETRNVEPEIIRELYLLYYAAVERECQKASKNRKNEKTITGN